MQNLSNDDYELITQATEIIKKNFDDQNYFHTVGAALRCRNGNIYLGVNVYSGHGSCAEYIAIGAAITAGERDFDCIVAVRGDEPYEVYPPCGNCRQMMSQYMHDGYVIVNTEIGINKIPVKDLLPYPYLAK